MPPCPAPTVSVGPTGCPVGLPLLDCPKIAPPSSWRHRSPLPASTLAGTAFGKSLPRLLHVPPSWFSTTSTVYASDAGRVYCNALPTLGFTPFSDRRPPGCPGCCASFPGMPSLPFEAFPPSVAASLPSAGSARERADPSTRGPRGLRQQRVATLFTAHLASSPFPSPSRERTPAVARMRASRSGSVGPRGLPPRTGPLQDRRLPADHARCSPGLARIQRHLPHRER